MSKPKGDRCDVFLTTEAHGYRIADHDLVWAGTRNGKVVALFSDQDDANAWLKSVDPDDTEPQDNRLDGKHKVEDARDVI